MMAQGRTKKSSEGGASAGPQHDDVEVGDGFGASGRW